MSELTERLRAAALLSETGGGEWYQLIHRCREAADRIEELEAEADMVPAGSWYHNDKLVYIWRKADATD